MLEPAIDASLDVEGRIVRFPRLVMCHLKVESMQNLRSDFVDLC
jgi:hypothetical protein